MSYIGETAAVTRARDHVLAEAEEAIRTLVKLVEELREELSDATELAHTLQRELDEARLS